MTTTAIETEPQIGKIIQVIGPVLDVEFETEHLPEIYNALRIEGKTQAGVPINVTVEVQQHIGRNQVRAVAMSSTDGIERGMDVIDTGSPIRYQVIDWEMRTLTICPSHSPGASKKTSVLPRVRPRQRPRWRPSINTSTVSPRRPRSFSALTRS